MFVLNELDPFLSRWRPKGSGRHAAEDAMFDLIATGHRPSTSSGIVPLLTSWAIHAIVIGAVVVLPLLYATDQLPDAPSEVLAFVAPAPPAPPPPPPPAAPAALRPVAREPRPVPRVAVPAPAPSIPIAPPIEDV